MDKEITPLSPEDRISAKNDFYKKKPLYRHNFPVANAEQRKQRAIDESVKDSIKDEQFRKKNVEKVEQAEQRQVNIRFNNALKEARKYKNFDSTRAVTDDDFGASSGERPSLERAETAKIANRSKTTKSNAIDKLLQGDAREAIKLLNDGLKGKKPTQPQLVDGEEIGRRGKPVDKNKGEFSRKIIEEQVNNGKQR